MSDMAGVRHMGSAVSAQTGAYEEPDDAHYFVHGAAADNEIGYPVHRVLVVHGHGAGAVREEREYGHCRQMKDVDARPEMVALQEVHKEDSSG